MHRLAKGKIRNLNLLSVNMSIHTYYNNIHISDIQIFNQLTVIDVLIRAPRTRPLSLTHKGWTKFIQVDEGHMI